MEASNRNCPHGEDLQIPFSGSIIRKGIVDGQPVPEEVMRPDVLEVIRRFEKPFVESQSGDPGSGIRDP